MKNIVGDHGYSGKENRSFCRQREIETSFSQKGRKSKNEIKIVLKQELARVRATAMEGSFGIQKEHYGLKRLWRGSNLRRTSDLLRNPHSKCCTPQPKTGNG